nr:hypothetical protein [Paenibacillus piri]
MADGAHYGRRVDLRLPQVNLMPETAIWTHYQQEKSIPAMPGARYPAAPASETNPLPEKTGDNREIRASNQLWEMDVKYGYIAAEQRFFFLLSLIDVYDRSIIDYHMGLSCEGKHAAQILQRAL